MSQIISLSRQSAWELLCALYRGKEMETPLPLLLERHLTKRKVAEKDQPLALELVYGLLRNRERTVCLLREFISEPEKLPPDLLTLLAQAGYELFFLNIPARATINEYVELARQKFSPRLGGLVNAVLRNADRDRERLLEQDQAFMRGDKASGTAESLARASSLPLWLGHRWIEDYGAKQAWAFAVGSNAKAPACWRLNLAAPDQEEVAALLLSAGAKRYGQSAFCFSKSPEICHSLEIQGKISRQGPGAILAAEKMAQIIREYPKAQESIWDACCGRGGKSLALLEQGLKLKLSSDPNAMRLNNLARNLGRLGLEAPKLLCDTAQNLAPDHKFSCIIVDAPCSGTGTLARVPELRLRLNQNAFAQLAEQQRNILNACWTALLPGGLLVYLTCALTKEENEARVGEFLLAHTPAKLEASQLFLPEVAGQDLMYMALISKS